MRHHGGVTTPAAFLSRLERLERVDSTQRVVREWLDAGTDQVCVAVADEQTAGRGRQGRGWVAPSGAALLVSAGFRPTGLPLRHAWRLAATCAMAMLDAAEDAAGLRDGTLWLKWPNDIVAEGGDGRLLKVAGVLGESTAREQDPDTGALTDTAIVGIGINADWAAADFPAELRDSMISLRELAGGRPVDRDALLDAWLARIEPRYEALLEGHFDAGGWSSRQRTTGRQVEVDLGTRVLTGIADGVDPDTGALHLAIRGGDGSPMAINSGEVIRCRVIDLPRPRS